MRWKGQITIFVTLLLLIVLPVFSLLTALAQKEASEAYFLYAAKSAKENMKASYCREFFEKYELFVLWEHDVNMEERMQGVLEKYQNPTLGNMFYWKPWIVYDAPSVDIYDYKMVTDQKGRYLEEQILEAEKDIVLLDSVFEALDHYEGYRNGWETYQDIAEAAAEQETSEKDQQEEKVIPSAEAADQTTSFFELLKELKEQPLITVLLGAEQISNRVLPFFDCMMLEEEDSGSKQEALEFYDKYLLANYIRRHFGDYFEENTDFYEMEYILSGEATDQKNFEKALEKFVLWKGAINLASALSNPEMTAQAEALTGGVPGLLGGEFVQESGKVLLLTAWSYGEAILDGRRILNGQKVVLWKEIEDWKLSLDNAKEVFQDSSLIMLSDEDGMEYDDYMMYLLILEDREEIRKRMMEVMQWNMQKENPYFMLEHCACSIWYELSAKSMWKISGLGDSWNRFRYLDSIQFVTP